MPYSGPRVSCSACGASFSRPADLRRHRNEGRCQGRRSAPASIVRAEPVRSSTALARLPAPARSRGLVRSGPEPPAWFEPFAHPELRRLAWARYSPETRRHIEQDHAILPNCPYSVGLSAGTLPSTVSLDDLQALSLGRAESPRAIEANVYGQYHFLKALAARLDGGIGTEQERRMFEAGLPAYLENRVRFNALRRPKALPAAG